MYNFVICISIIVVFLLIGFGSQYLLGPDNKAEELIEEVIQERFEIDIDFSDD